MKMTPKLNIFSPGPPNIQRTIFDLFNFESKMLHCCTEVWLGPSSRY